MPPLRDILAFMVGMAGVMSEFYGALDVHTGHLQLGLILLVAGLAALWIAFRVGSHG